MWLNFPGLFLLLQVKFFATNDFLHCRRYEISNRTARGNSLSDFSCRNIDFSADNRVGVMRLLATAIKDNKANYFFQISEATPFGELVHVIFTDQAVDQSNVFTLPNVLHRIDGVRGRWPPQLAIVHGESGFILNSGLYHQQPYFVAGDGRGPSERRYPGGNKDHFLGAESFKGLARNDKMAMMNRVKRAPVDCNLFQRSMLNVQRSIFNLVSCHVQRGGTSLI